jgi:SAM-dependent methyltransferase
MNDVIKAGLRTAYDADAARRGARNFDRWRQAIVDRFLDRLDERSVTKVLDAGCGTGQLAAYMAGRDFAVAAVDLSPGNVEASRHRGVDAEVGDFSALRHADASVGGVIAFNSLLHIPKADLVTVLRELRRVLVVGGLLQIVVWGGTDFEGAHEYDWLQPPRFFSFFSDASLLELEFPKLRRLETVLLHEHAEPDGYHLHPQAMLLEAV